MTTTTLSEVGHHRVVGTQIVMAATVEQVSSALGKKVLVELKRCLLLPKANNDIDEWLLLSSMPELLRP
jgi:hypothetical protein